MGSAGRAVFEGARGAGEWADRHPQRAAEETALRRERRTIRKDFGRSDVTAGTPETRYRASRTRQGSLARMFVAGDIDQHQLAAAADIARVAETLASDVRLRTISLETRVDGGSSRDAGFFEALGAVRREIAYTRWRRALPNPGPVLAMIVDDLGVREARKRWRMSDARAKALLVAALDLWAETVARAVKEIDAADLLAAQAGLS
jgi:hypothetical protein